MKGKAMKIIALVLFFVIILLLIPRVSFYIISIRNKSKIISLVRDNLEILNNSIEEGVYDEVLKIEGIDDINLFKTDEGNLYVDYFCSGFGIVPSGVYFGFYYHSIDEPIGYQGENVQLTEDGEGWSWHQIHGDNWYYTEKIEDNWYYYEVGF